MKRIIFVVSLCMPGMFLSVQDSHSHTLKQGALSLSGSSNIMYQYTSDYDIYSYSLSVQSGYFVRDNLEIAVQLSGYYANSAYHRETSAAITPLAMYHLPLGEASNVFAGAGGGYSWGEYSGNGINLAALLGWEYFLSNQIALHFKAQYGYFSFEDRSYNHRYIDVTSQLGFTVYF